MARGILLYIILGIAIPLFAFAFEATSTSFKLLDPVFSVIGGFATSTSYQLNQAASQPAIGTSTSPTSFRASGGFLYFPFVTKPVVTATPGDNKVTLTWTASQGFLGWTVSGYNVGQSTVQGGPYTYTSVGNIRSSPRTGLVGGTKYYFVVRPEDASGNSNSIATSTEVSATPTTPAPSPAPSPTPSPAPSGGGGGGGGILSTPEAETKLVLKGKAYPNADLTIFKDGAIAATPHVDSTGLFQITINVEGGLYTISLYAVDSKNIRSLNQSFTITVPKNVTVAISDIVIAPTIRADKSEVKYGNDILFFGYAHPQSQVKVITNSEEAFSNSTTSDRLGFWSYTLDSGNLERGDHVTKSQVVTLEGLQSPFSESVAFQVGDRDVAFSFGALGGKPAPEVCSKNGDINKDGKVNIIDFSILLFFWNQRNPKNPCADINKDGIANLFDFSIMLFWWTG